MSGDNIPFNRFSIIFLLIFFGCAKGTYRTPAEVNNEVLIKPTLNEENQLSLDCYNIVYPSWKTSEYVLPYPVGKTYSISGSHCSGYYHGPGKPDQFAIDFNMSIGTAITAARSGKVVHVEESGIDGSFPNNLVVVAHSDGTYLQYMHLTKNGAEVVVGQQVRKGQLLGYSGNTGLAGFPHLHLVATKGTSWKFPYTSFPTTFSNTKNNERSLRQGESYEALPY